MNGIVAISRQLPTPADSSANSVCSDSIAFHSKRKLPHSCVDSYRHPPYLPSSLHHGFSVPISSADLFYDQSHCAEEIDLVRTSIEWKSVDAHVSSVISAKLSGKSNDYYDLCAEIRQKAPPLPAESKKRLLWILALSRHVSRLNFRDFREIVEAALAADWIADSNLFVYAYTAFLESLVAAQQASFIEPVLRMLVPHLTQSHELTMLAPEALKMQELIFKRAHKAIARILRLVPTADRVLAQIISEEFPHKTASLAANCSFLENLLQVCLYAEGIQDPIWQVIIDRLLQIDVEIQVELDELEDDDDLPTVSIEQDKEEIFNIEIADSDSEDDWSPNPREQATQNVKDAISKLDSMLLSLFRKIEALPIRAKNSKQTGMRMFCTLLECFERQILPTNKSRYTQFLLFYTISRHTELSDYFLGFLTMAITETNVDGSPSTKKMNSTVRMACANYCGSFVARSKFVSRDATRAVIGLLLNWAQLRLKLDEEEQRRINWEQWKVWYSVIQAILYVFCFRWQDFQLSPDEAEQVKGRGPESKAWWQPILLLRKILLSRLKPLRICASDIVNQFVVIANNLKLMSYKLHPYEGERTNIRIRNASIHQVAALESYYPFDPYELSQTACFITPMYKVWDIQNEASKPGMSHDDGEYEDYDKEFELEDEIDFGSELEEE